MYREKTIKDALYQAFDNVDSRPGRGGTYDYIKWQHVADRMNQVFGTYWTSEVMSEHILNNDNDIVLRIRVKVADPETNETFSQEGYGGATVRAGEDVGTAFKSAYSKGIKDACKKWGIGLYLTEDGGESVAPRSAYAGSQPYVPPTQPSPVQPTPVLGIPATPMPVSPITTTVPTAPVIPSVPTPQIQSPASVQPIPVQPISGTVGLPITPVATIMPAGPAPIMQTPVQPIAPVEQHVAPAQDNFDMPGTATAVQSLAISNMARIHGATTESDVLAMIINTATTGLDRHVNELKDLSYNEAVKIIRIVKELQEKDNRR